MTKEPEGKWCGGVIIDKNHLLSAAHCYTQYLKYVSLFPASFQSLPGAGVKWGVWAYFGNFSQKLGPSLDTEVFGKLLQKVEVVQIINHEDFSANNTTILYDIAILRVAEPFEDEYILPICDSDRTVLSKFQKSDKSGAKNVQKLLMSGLGKGEGNQNPEELKSVRIDADEIGSCGSRDTQNMYICVKGKWENWNEFFKISDTEDNY